MIFLCKWFFLRIFRQFLKSQQKCSKSLPWIITSFPILSSRATAIRSFEQGQKCFKIFLRFYMGFSRLCLRYADFTSILLDFFCWPHNVQFSCTYASLCFQYQFRGPTRYTWSKIKIGWGGRPKSQRSKQPFSWWHQ